MQKRSVNTGLAVNVDTWYAMCRAWRLASDFLGRWSSGAL